MLLLCYVTDWVAVGGCVVVVYVCAGVVVVSIAVDGVVAGVVVVVVVCGAEFAAASVVGGIGDDVDVSCVDNDVDVVVCGCAAGVVVVYAMSCLICCSFVARVSLFVFGALVLLVLLVTLTLSLLFVMAAMLRSLLL